MMIVEEGELLLPLLLASLSQDQQVGLDLIVHQIYP